MPRGPHYLQYIDFFQRHVQKATLVDEKKKERISDQPINGYPKLWQTHAQAKKKLVATWQNCKINFSSDRLLFLPVYGLRK